MTTAPTRKTVAVDLDGVLADFSGGWKGLDHFGAPIPGAVDFTRRLSEFADVLIWTTRCSPEIGRGEGVNLLRNRVRDWLDAHGFVYAGIWTGTGKPIAAAFVDDRAIVCAPEPKYKAKAKQRKTLLENDYRWAIDAAIHLCNLVPPGCSLNNNVTSLDPDAAPSQPPVVDDLARPAAWKLTALADFLERDGLALREGDMPELVAWVRREAARGGGG